MKMKEKKKTLDMVSIQQETSNNLHNCLDPTEAQVVSYNQTPGLYDKDMQEAAITPLPPGSDEETPIAEDDWSIFV